ncbi:hypothetical protein IGI04_025534 [Brassica rapa subsp. trilocularis]|uniref:DUF4283 domain-containing protein n=1 Tax=Brassica rapa subsp. trilocularis TaxID=1813537 RepID=A0ABQ7KTB4_BRACM|nr:hypothetical protein IGI04_025534 [Brassica rapa subsp. trilocularis]
MSCYEAQVNQRVRVSKGWSSKRCHWIKALADPVGNSLWLQSGWAWALLGCMDPNLGPDQVRRSVSLWAGLMEWPTKPSLTEWLDETMDNPVMVGSRSFELGLVLELRLILVKPRSRENSINERLCSVRVDHVRNKLITAYRTHCNFCIGSHLD